MRRRVLILGAAGRDFHDFNVVFREDGDHEVVGFTASQIPKIEGRRYPPSLAGPLYPDGIPIHPESELETLIATERVDEVVFAYSDVDYDHIGHLVARANAAGADFRLIGTGATMLKAEVPVLAVTAVRTGCGKTPVSRYAAEVLRKAGLQPVVVRHPMPYGDLAAQAVQRFATRSDLDQAHCTFEEREEYESHLQTGSIVYAGVDYGAILDRASQEADVLIWDGGNNDWPFYTPDLWITVADPLRPGHETRYHPGEVNLRRADLVLVNKVDHAHPGDVEAVIRTARTLNPRARVFRCRSAVSVPDPERIRGRRVLCIDDGPTLTHGGMAFGAAFVAAERLGAKEIVDPRPHAVGSLRRALEADPHIGRVLPAMGYFPEQIADLEASIHAVDCDVVLIGTPFDLASQLVVDREVVRVAYRLEPETPGDLETALLAVARG